ncbi:hypothetical protein G6F46_013781 [Rhizopus delemar]|nr:hypothetical protein G6F46_013781 [Rhizopus delemar]
MLRRWANYKLPGMMNRVSVGAGVNTQPDTISSDREFKLAGLTVWNARVGYQATSELSFALNLNNVFDKKYYVPSYNTVYKGLRGLGAHQRMDLAGQVFQRKGFGQDEQGGFFGGRGDAAQARTRHQQYFQPGTQAARRVGDLMAADAARQSQVTDQQV